MVDLPVVCTLTPAALAARREGLLLDLVRRAQQHQLLADGHRFVFLPSDDLLLVIARAVEAERQCCRFLRFAICVEPDGGSITLDLVGPPGTREFLSALLEA